MEKLRRLDSQIDRGEKQKRLHFRILIRIIFFEPINKKSSDNQRCRRPLVFLLNRVRACCDVKDREKGLEKLA